MAVECIRHPAAWPCENCDCVDGIAPEKRWHTPGVIKATDVCYRQAVTPRSNYLISLFTHYEKGFLYRSGGIGDQPALYVQAMTFLRSYGNRS